MLPLVCLILSAIYGCLGEDLIYFVEEGKIPGSFVGDIAADMKLRNEIPKEEQNHLKFNQLQQGMSSSIQLFQVSQKTGKLFTAQKLDAEIMCKKNEECFKLLDVAVQKGTSIIKILEIKVVIKDVNDHQPEFPQKEVTIEFSEESPKGSIRQIPNAIDKDISDVNSMISYELKTNSDDLFDLLESQNVIGGSDLSIVLEKVLDREEKDSYTLQLIAKDGGKPSKQGSLIIHVIVADINDNLPVFSHKVYNVSIKTDHNLAIPVTILSATDLDSGKNGRVYYQFSSETPKNSKTLFQIEEETGKIFLHEKLTSIHKITHKLYVKVTDRGNPPLSTIAKVLVNVINLQNNPPVIKVNFAKHSEDNKVNILENIKVGSFIAYVKVSDQDAGQNGEVNCEIEHDKFQLQNMGTKKYQVIVKTLLDRETEEHHSIIIKCQDKGSPPLQSERKIAVHVLDVNDERPQFSRNTFKFFIGENQRSKIPVGNIQATDPDLGLGGELSYSLLTTNKQFLPFRITEKGLISSIMSLDREFQDIYKFKVFVKDKGTPSLNNTVNVIIEVKDENDNAPHFTFPSFKPYNMDVTYYPHHTKNITQIKASDSDSQENAFLKYQIIRGNDKQMFTMNQYTGLLAFNRQLNPENAGSYQLDIVVKDSGSPILSATTTLFLTLTISNKTSQMLNVIELESEEKVHLKLVIIITVIAVTIAVFITASLSICIIRCNGQTNVAYAHAIDPSNKYASEQRHLISPFYQEKTWPYSISAEETLKRNATLTRSMKQHYFTDDFNQKPLTSSELTAQIPVSPENYAWRPANREYGWSEDETEKSLLMTGLPSKVSLPEQFDKSDISDQCPQSKHSLKMNTQHTSNTRPLPPVPHINT